jgi:peptidoglycan/xylan/chitin deacetylase (PgdA/CDA1 family)
MRRTALVAATALALLMPLMPVQAHVVSAVTVPRAASPAVAPTGSAMRYVTRVRTTKRVVFITVDDGIVRDREFLRLVRRTHLPVTVFLTLDYARSAASARYFRQLKAAGAVIENHTIGHPDLRRVGDRQLRREVCTAAAREKKLFGRAPTLFRAPYGAVDDRVLGVARSCGMTTVGWDAVMPERGPLETWSGHGRLNPGDIVLLHFVPGLVPQLRRVLAEAERRHLRVAQLEDFVHAPRTAGRD